MFSFSLIENNNKKNTCAIIYKNLYLQLNKVHELAEQIGKKLAQAEKLGAEGNVEDSMKTLEEVEEFRKQKASAEVILFYFSFVVFDVLYRLLNC